MFLPSKTAISVPKLFYKRRLKNHVSDIEALIVSLRELSCKVAELPRWLYSREVLITVATLCNGKPTPIDTE